MKPWEEDFEQNRLKDRTWRQIDILSVLEAQQEEQRRVQEAKDAEERKTAKSEKYLYEEKKEEEFLSELGSDQKKTLDYDSASLSQ